MNANIFKFEFRTRLRSVITWSVSCLAILFIFFSIFPAFADQADLINQMWAKFPPQMRAAFGMDKMDMATVMGFYGFMMLFIELCLAIQASNYGFGLVSVEEAELTADFLLTKPVSRTQVMTSKLLAAITSMVLTNLMVWVSSFGSILMFKGEREYEPGTLVLLLSSIFVFQLFFLGVGLMISLLVKRVRSVTPYALGLSFGMYVLSAFSGMFGDVKLELITPFKHFDPAYIIENGAFDTPLVLLNVGVTLFSVVLSYWLYTRRDIPAVS